MDVCLQSFAKPRHRFCPILPSFLEDSSSSYPFWSWLAKSSDPSRMFHSFPPSSSSSSSSTPPCCPASCPCRCQFQQCVYTQLLRAHIPKVQKRQSTQVAFCAFGIFGCKRFAQTHWWNLPQVTQVLSIFFSASLSEWREGGTFINHCVCR